MLNHSADVYFPTVGVFLPLRVQDWSEFTESTIDVILLRSTCLSGCRTASSWQSESCTCSRGSRLLTKQSSPTTQIRWSLLLLIATFILTTFPLLPLILPSVSIPYILPLLLLIVFFLNLSTSYFQSAALALASLWGSSEILAALSGQGGVAVLISLVQVILAVVGALGSDEEAGDEAPSMLAGVGLWGLGSAGAGLCWLAYRFLVSHPAYERVVGVSMRTERLGHEGVKKGNWDRTVGVLDKNKLLYLAVALDFAVTLVSILRPLFFLNSFQSLTNSLYSQQSPHLSSRHMLLLRVC